MEDLETMPLEQLWDQLSEGLGQVFQVHKAFPPNRYIELYTLVFNHCTHGADAARQNHAVDFVGNELYDKLGRYLDLYNNQLLMNFNGLHDQVLLERYGENWNKYDFSSNVLQGVFAYLNRHWIKQEIDAGNQNVYVVRNLCLLKWKQKAFDNLNANMTNAMLDMIERARNGEVIRGELIGRVLKSYVDAGVNGPDKATAKALPELGETMKKLSLYKHYFESKFLNKTRQYYAQEAGQLVQQNPVTTYMQKVQNRIEEECQRCLTYLDHSTQEPLAHCLNDVLIKDHLEWFQSEFEELLVNQKDDDLSRMYFLCERVPSGLDPMKVTLEKYIAKEGKKAISSIIESVNSNPKVFVAAALGVHDRFSQLIDTSFRQDSGFIEALDKGCTAFINNNAVTEMYKSPSRSSDILCRYTNSILQKGSKIAEERETEDLLKQVMVIFKYIHDKDVFQKTYGKLLCRRLISDMSANSDAERSILSKMKEMCGFEYVSKLTRMFSDACLSKDLTEKYKRHLQNLNDDSKIDFSIVLLASNVWPFPITAEFALPPVIEKSVKSFTEFYKSEHNGRKLAWILTNSRGELNSYCFSRKYTFIATAPQMAILMLCNENVAYSLDKISELTRMPKDQLVSNLQTIIRLKLISLQSGDTDLTINTPDDSVLMLNEEFSNRKLKVDLSKMVAKVDIKKEETDDVQKSVDEDRCFAIQAAIVRVLKARKQIKHNQLIAEILSTVSNRFQVKLPLIKKCIDLLIEKSYMKRLDNERDMYEYLA
ncbi:cullin family domain-containing protein [Ditylenchus destructor]|nr:cullin family domain-containing protein [Ditylenchus destructor]